MPLCVGNHLFANESRAVLPSPPCLQPVPAAAVVAGSTYQPAPRTVADCAYGPGLNIGLNAVGAPFPTKLQPGRRAASCDRRGAQCGAIVACRDVQGCLSNYVNGPGYVQVPHRDTTVRQSQ
jgi:hypothetical protein